MCAPAFEDELIGSRAVKYLAHRSTRGSDLESDEPKPRRVAWFVHPYARKSNSAGRTKQLRSDKLRYGDFNPELPL